MSYQAHIFVDGLRVETAGEKSFLHALARAHSHRTGKCDISVNDTSRRAFLSQRHGKRVARNLIERGVLRCEKGKSSVLPSRWQFLGFCFTPTQTGDMASPVLVTHHVRKLVTWRHRLIRKRGKARK